MNTKNDAATLSAEIKGLRQDFKLLRTAIDAALERFRNTVEGLGARWGLMSEEAFRNALAAILTDEIGFQVQRYQGYDDSGSVYGHRDQVEMDVIIQNGLTIAIEIKSSISRGDLALFLRKIAFYEQTEGVSIDRKFVISPFIDAAAVETAHRMGVELYSHSAEIVNA